MRNPLHGLYVSSVLRHEEAAIHHRPPPLRNELDAGGLEHELRRSSGLLAVRPFRQAIVSERYLSVSSKVSRSPPQPRRAILRGALLFMLTECDFGDLQAVP